MRTRTTKGGTTTPRTTPSSPSVRPSQRARFIKGRAQRLEEKALVVSAFSIGISPKDDDFFQVEDPPDPSLERDFNGNLEEAKKHWRKIVHHYLMEILLLKVFSQFFRLKEKKYSDCCERAQLADNDVIFDVLCSSV